MWSKGLQPSSKTKRLQRRESDEFPAPIQRGPSSPWPTDQLSCSAQPMPKAIQMELFLCQVFQRKRKIIPFWFKSAVGIRKKWKKSKQKLRCGRCLLLTWQEWPSQVKSESVAASDFLIQFLLQAHMQVTGTLQLSHIQMHPCQNKANPHLSTPKSVTFNFFESFFFLSLEDQFSSCGSALVMPSTSAASISPLLAHAQEIRRRRSSSLRSKVISKRPSGLGQ